MDLAVSQRSSLPCLWLPLFSQLSPDESACFYGCFSTQNLSRNSTAQPFLLLLNSNTFPLNCSRNRSRSCQSWWQSCLSGRFSVGHESVASLCEGQRSSGLPRAPLPAKPPTHPQYVLRQSYHVVLTSLKLTMILLPEPPKCWDYRLVLPCWASGFHQGEALWRHG